VRASHEDLLGKVSIIAERVARSFELEIFDVQLERESIGWVLRVVLDRSNGDSKNKTVSILDCQRVSKDLSAVLDAEITFESTYTLEVSSPGLDRPLRNLDDCRRFIGRLAKFVTNKPVNGQHHLTGRMTAVEDKEIVIKTNQGSYKVPWSVITRARLDVEF
jgi:ribosome maturation factor RimP